VAPLGGERPLQRADLHLLLQLQDRVLVAHAATATKIVKHHPAVLLR
jgi:uncharacterized protein Yka (UPF0111/DUF47 family)